MKKLIVSAALSLAICAQAAQPTSVYESNINFPFRRVALINSWLSEFPNRDFTQFGRWVKIDDAHPSQASYCLRKIAAGLAAMKYSVPGAPDRSFPATVENWVKANVYANEEMGSSGQSFDMTMIQMLNLVLMFKDNPDLLTPTTVNYLLGIRASTTSAIQPYFMGYDLQNMVFVNHDESFPETENHVLMGNIWRYLATQRAYELNLFPASINKSVDNSALEAGLLAILGRIPQNGFFEANARPYQALTIHALITLYSYANENSASGKKIKTAAKNALDYAFLHYSFQSINSKRQSGQRRNWDDYRNSTGITEGDYTSSMVAMLTGLNSFSDNYAALPAQHKGYALWAGLSNYRIPDPILDFFVNPDNGRTGYAFWARMQSRFTGAHYNKGEWSRYAVVLNPYLYHPAIPYSGVTNGHGDPDLSGGDVEPALEFYFGTRDYLNTAGGHYDHYPALNLATLADKVYIYDFFTKPSVLIQAGNMVWKDGTDVSDEKSKTAVSEGQGAPWQLKHTQSDGGWDCSWWPPGCYFYYNTTTTYTTEPGYIQANNIGTYKNIMLGYNTDHSKPPISIPASFGSPVQHESYVNTTSTIYQVDIYSPTNVIDPGTVPGLSNYYVLIYRTTNNSGADNYNRAIMEVIPKSKYPNSSTILAKFKQYPRVYNRYHSIVSDEDLVTNDKFGLAGEESQSPFLSISKNGGSNEVLIDHSDISTQANVNAMPLIDVRQVDDNYNFTGVKYAYSAGGGLITINNPRYGIYTIDSRNFLVPATSVPLANMVANIVPTVLAPLALN